MKKWLSKLGAKVNGYALVTGGASGIGEALCLQLADAKIPVIIGDINATAGKKLAEKIESNGSISKFVLLDVTNRDNYIELINRLEDEGIIIDLIISNAGIGTGGEIIDMTPEDWKSIIDVNLYGVVNGIDAVYSKMIKRGSGTIVNVASVAGLYPLPAEAAYAASKYAVVGLTKVLEIEAKAYGVKAILVCPGKIETPIYQTSDVRGFDKQKALELWPKGISPAACAETILKGIANNESMIVITPLAKTLWAIERSLPSISKQLGHFYINQMRKHRIE